VIQDQAGQKLAALSDYLGHQTNNFAEYQALIAALEYAVEHGHKALKVVSDSELMVRQIKGVYKVKNAALQDLYVRAKELIGKLDWFYIEHVLRGKNAEADRLANEAMDRGSRAKVSNSGPEQPSAAPPAAAEPKILRGIYRNGVVELLEGAFPEGTWVEVRAKK
jgi:ribonuclease HI